LAEKGISIKSVTYFQSSSSSTKVPSGLGVGIGDESADVRLAADYLKMFF
jgi:hypothetical protein